MKQEILDDIRKVAGRLGLKPGDKFSRSEYLNNGARFSHYDLYDGGMNFTVYCEGAGYKPKAKEPVPDEVYFERYQKAVSELGRPPKSSERKMFGLTVPTRRRGILDEFNRRLISEGNGEASSSKKVEARKDSPKVEEEHPKNEPIAASQYSRPIPPIPERTKRKKWERTGVEGFPYAPQDESGVIALFSVLCAQGIIPWQILDLNSGKGIDAVCYDDRQHREIRVELKHTLSRSNWNHSVDSVDYVVCWENRWRDFPKPVKELKALVKR